MSATLSRIPLFGFGTWKIPKDKAATAVYEAIKLGIRHIDCACDYGNEAQVGDGIQRAIHEGLVRREDLWITSKLWNTYHADEHVEPAARRSLNDLKIEYFDLYLIHFPFATKYVPFDVRYPPEWIYEPSAPNPRIEMARVPISETWRAMERLHAHGLAKNIGVCNFNVQLLLDLLSYCNVPPLVNQVEMHPYLTQQALLDFCKERGVQVTAFSPLGSSSYVELNMDYGQGRGVLEDPVVKAVAAAKGRSPAQVVLRWGIQRGVSVIPKSSNPAHIAENFDVFGFELTSDEVRGTIIEFEFLEKRHTITDDVCVH
jgi:D-xylose reductase